jgi:hypothetical protein
MIKWSVCGPVLALLLFGGSAARADILYFSDATMGTDSMALALNQWAAAHPGTSVFSTSSDTTFATQLTSGKYNLAVFFVQNFGPSYYPTGVAALQAYVAAGGKAIVTDYNTMEGSSFIAPFGATFSGPTNNTQFTVTNPSLNPGLYKLTNAGWGMFSTDLTPTTGIGAAYFTVGNPTSAAIVIGNGGRTILNGFLNDTIVNSSQGTALYTAQISSLESGKVPEPGSLTLLGMGAAVMAGYSWRRRKRAKLRLARLA